MFNTVMLALEGTEQMDSLVSSATQLMNPDGRLLIAHVTELIGGRGAGRAHVDEDERIANVRRRVESLAAAGVDVVLVRCTTLRSPADAIARLASRRQPDVIVVEACGHNALMRALNGDTPGALIRKARCPVLVVSTGDRDRQPAALAA